MQNADEITTESMSRKANFYLLFLIILTSVAVAAIAWDDYSWKKIHPHQMIAFQSMVGGIGMGAIGAPMWNFINFDPRIQPVDDSTLWPIPGGYSYGPDRTATVTYFEEIPNTQLIRKNNN